MKIKRGNFAKGPKQKKKSPRRSFHEGGIGKSRKYIQHEIVIVTIYETITRHKI